MKKLPLFIGVLLSFLFASCDSSDQVFDASGSFEAEEIIVSAEGTGELKSFELEEGQLLKKEQCLGYIDTVQLDLKRQQLVAQYKALLSKQPDVDLQLSVLKSKLATAEREKARIERLIKGDAATSKQLDDVTGQVDVLKREIAAQHSGLRITTEGITLNANALLAQKEILDDQIKRCQIVNPIAGTVLVKYARQYEFTAVSKPLYKLADLTKIYLNAYITGDQLVQVKLGQKVQVSTDDGNGGFNTTEGTVYWISDEAEFTPKTIQTKNERANLVYAIKVRVQNDGSNKIGMYGQIKF